MRRILRHRPSPAMVVACLALTVALGGTSYAAISLPRNSVGTKQLRTNAVTSAKVRNNALTGVDILESRLGRVPAATAAITAQTASAAGSATNATNATYATSAGTASPSGAASGDLAGSYPAPTIAADAVTAAKVINASQSTGLRRADIAAVATTVSFDPPSIAANACGGDIATVPGAQAGDIILAQPESGAWNGLIYAPWAVAAGGSVNLRICNVTAGAIDGSAIDFQLLLIR
jgi:hypothetical protein